MKESNQLKKVVFCCPHHGLLHEMVEYASVTVRTRKFVNIPVVYCRECSKYYTPFANLLALIHSANPHYKGRPIAVTQGRVEKSFPRVEVRAPYSIDIRNSETQDKQTKSVNRTECKFHKDCRIVNIGNRSFKIHGRRIIMVNYPCNECVICHGRLIKFSRPIRIDSNEARIISGKYCTKCDTFYANHSTEIEKLCNDSPFQQEQILDLNYLFPDYSEKERNIHLLKTLSIAVHLYCRETHTHRIIAVVSAKNERNTKEDFFHYSDKISRQIICAIFKKKYTVNIENVTYDLLKILDINNGTDSILHHLSTDRIVLRSGGGLYGGIHQENVQLIDVLLYSPFTACLEIAHVSYDTENKLYYMDAKVFRKFIARYGNPGIKIAAYRNNPQDFTTLKEESILHAYGYKVGKNGLTESERKGLLAEIMDLGIMSAGSILCLLELNISMHTDDKYDIARNDWLSDKEFVMSYKINPERFVVATVGL